MAEKILTHIVYNGEEYQMGNFVFPFTLTESNGATMSACTATGNYAVAEGSGTTASGTCSHAEGRGTKAYGGYSHAEGNGTTASGSYSHAEGSSTTASRDYSHAEGSGTKASGWYSHAEGKGTSATTDSEHASGQYNVSLSGSSTWGNSGNTLFTVGNGDDSSNTHNALQIMQDGTIYIVDTSSTGKFYEKSMIKLQEVIKDLQNRIAVLEANEVTKTEVENGFVNIIQVEDNKLKVNSNALEDKSTKVNINALEGESVKE